MPMALGIVGAYGGLTKKEISDCLFVGELSLDGGVRGIRGTLPIALEARGRKISRLVVPEANAREAAMVGESTFTRCVRCWMYPLRELRQTNRSPQSRWRRPAARIPGISRGLQRRSRSANRQARHRNLLRRKGTPGANSG
ncbi:MAG: magnesium chelatase domain-containing protein [Candidatus Sulfotelmatobacter sp.]